MHNITLITTRHEAKGLCNASALHEILERGRPEVIFLETPPSFFDQYFKEKNDSNLESDAINLYLKTHGSTKLVPVDINEVPQDFSSRSGNLFRKVNSYSYEYGQLVNRHSQCVERSGFTYLNSKSCIDLWVVINESVKVAVEEIGQKELSRDYAYWKNLMEHREREMMKNIQKYCEEHEFNSGVFLIGAAHRGAIVEKSKNISPRSSVTINWNFERYEGLIDDSMI